MKRFTLAAALLVASCSASPAFAQSLTLTNLKGPVARACKVPEAKSIAELWRQLNGCNHLAPAPAPTPSPTPAPTPTPAPAPLSGTLSEGDSLSVFWPGNHTGIHAAAHPGERFIGKAVGGSGIETLAARFAASAAERPARVTVLIGANGLSPTFLSDLAAYAARWKATGARVYLSTIPPQCNAAFNARRNAVNPAIRALGYDVIDYAADPVIGPDAAGCDKTLFSDGVHPTDPTHGANSGQARMALVYSAVLDGKPAPAPAPAPEPEPPHHHPEPPPVASFPQHPAPDADFGVPLTKGTQPAWGNGAIPGIYNVHEGAFRFVCGGDGPLAHDDPVLYPGQPGRSHLHDVWGNREFGAFTTPETLAKSASTNCNETPFSTNRSSYWMPALIHDNGQVVRPDLVMVYYKRKTSVSPFCREGAREFMGKCVVLPNRIKFIFGWDMFNPAAPVKGAWWYCSGAQGHFPDLDAVFAAGCKPGDDLVADTVAPNCWNGRDLDSADHRGHMAYADYSDGSGFARCPKTHPFLIAQEENKAQYRVTADMIGADGRSRVRLASDSMLPGAKPGQTLHADYMEMWQADAKRAWHEGCIDRGLDCSGGDLGNGRQLIGAAQPRYGWRNPAARVAVPVRPVTDEHAH